MKRARVPPRSPRRFAVGLLAAGLAVIGMIALGNRIGLGHVLAGLGLAIPPIRGAVVHLAGAIHPDETRSAAGCLSHARSGTALRGGGRLSGGRRRCSSRCRSCRWRCSRSRRRSCRRRRAARARVPVLNTLMAVACAAFGGARPVGAVLTQARRACGSAGRRRRLCQGKRRSQYTGTKCNESCSVKHL